MCIRKNKYPKQFYKTCVRVVSSWSRCSCLLRSNSLFFNKNSSIFNHCIDLNGWYVEQWCTLVQFWKTTSDELRGENLPSLSKLYQYMHSYSLKQFQPSCYGIHSQKIWNIINFVLSNHKVNRSRLMDELESFGRPEVKCFSCSQNLFDILG